MQSKVVREIPLVTTEQLVDPRSLPRLPDLSIFTLPKLLSPLKERNNTGLERQIQGYYGDIQLSQLTLHPANLFSDPPKRRLPQPARLPLTEKYSNTFDHTPNIYKDTPTAAIDHAPKPAATL